MKRLTALGASVLLLGGCALPLPVQVASWALDGILYATTEKSLADHGISVVAEKDCGMLRGVLNGGAFCIEDDAATLVADADGGTPLGAAAGIGGNDEEIPADIAAEIEALASFDTAAGGDAVETAVLIDAGPIAGVVAWTAAGVSADVLFERADPLPGYPTVIGAATPAPAAAPAETAETGIAKAPPADFDALDTTVDLARDDDAPAIEVAMASVSMLDGGAGLRGEAAEEPEAGLYFVIGSFREHNNARKLRRTFRALTPSVLAAKLDGGMVFRVVVGPFGQDQAKGVHQRIFDAGISDSWAIRVRPGEWSMALVDPPAEAPAVAELETGNRGWDPMVIVEMLARLIL